MAMNRILLWLITLLLFAADPFADAQQAGKVPRIGVLVSASASASVSRIHAFRQGLHALGYIEGKNIIVEYRYAEGNPNRLQELVAGLFRLKVVARCVSNTFRKGQITVEALS